MPLKLLEMQDESEFPAVIQAEWEAFETPYCHLLPLFFPTHGMKPDARTEAMKAGCERQTHWFKGDPTSRWVKVIDTETGRVAGGALWHVFTENPYAKPDDEEISWWAKGEDREMATLLFSQFLTPRMTYMAKPHVFLDILFTHPDYRRRGVGRLLMDYGVQKADELNLEAYIDSTDIGKLLYEKYGFIAAEGIPFDPSRPDPSERWQQLEKILLPFTFYPMWRPAAGRKEEAKNIPWGKQHES